VVIDHVSEVQFFLSKEAPVTLPKFGTLHET